MDELLYWNNDVLILSDEDITSDSYSIDYDIDADDEE